MKPNTQIRHSLLFLFDWGKSVEEAVTAIQQAYGEDAINRTTCLRWFQRFRSGDKSLQDKEIKERESVKPNNRLHSSDETIVSKKGTNDNSSSSNRQSTPPAASLLQNHKQVNPPAPRQSTPPTCALVQNHKQANSPTSRQTTALVVMQNNKQVNPFLIKKWEHIFMTFFDRNHSKQMDWGDFYLVVRRVRDVYGAESVAYAYARKSMEALWQGLCKLADSDDDQLISMEEWVDLLKRIEVKHQSEPRWFNEYQNFMFKLFDVSGDGVVDLIEYVDGMSIYGYSYQECVESFKAFAIDNKGKPLTKIEPEHWKKMFLDLFFSIDKTLPGNNLFGKLKNN